MLTATGRTVLKEDSYKSIALSLVAFSLPLILSGVLQQLYSWADAFIVGNTEGSAALAAIGSTTAIVNDLQDKPEGLDVSVLSTDSVSGLPVAPHPYG